MLCTFDAKKRFRKLLDFPCTTDWADTTSDWADRRKRKIISKKDKPPKCAAPRKTTKLKTQELSKPRKPIYLKAIESKSAGHAGRVPKKPVILTNPLDHNREAVKCKVVSLHGLGSKLSVGGNMRVPSLSGNMRVQSVPNVNDQWEEGDLPSDRSNHSVCSLGSTINIDSGHKNNRFHKEQLLLQLHDRSASLLKYLFGTGDSVRTKELHPDSISLPIRERSIPQHEVPKKKHIILNPKDPEQLRFGEDYIGSLIPEPYRPLGHGLFGSPTQKIKLSHKTLEFPDLGNYSTTNFSNFLVPPVGSSHPIRSSIDLTKQSEDESYIKSVSQLVGMLCIEPTSNSLPQHTIQQWLDT